MTAPTRPPRAARRDDTARVLAMFAAGHSLEGQLYSHEEFSTACDYALDAHDFSELDFMLDREAAYERFLAASPLHCERDDLGDFSTWCARFAPEAAPPGLAAYARREVFKASEIGEAA